MCSSALNGFRAVVARAHRRWFHAYWLPSMWLAAILVLWCNAWLGNWHGDRMLYVFIAGLAGLWADMLLPPTTPSFLWFVMQCIGGVPVMALLGVFQDALHVPRRVVLLYLMAPCLSFIGLAILQGGFDAPEFLVRLFLVHFCIDLYIVSLGSCALYLILFVGRKSVRRT